MVIATKQPTAEDLQRAKAAAWDFLTGYVNPDPIPGATLGEYLDAAYAYSCDTTHVDLATHYTPQEHAKAKGAELIRRFFHMLPKEREFFVTTIDLNRRNAASEVAELAAELKQASKDRGIATMTVLALYDPQGWD